jgi:hypothetical protein
MSGCRQLRRKLVRYGTALREEWVTEWCGAPLFSEKDLHTARCKACRNGWSHRNNYPVDAVEADFDPLGNARPGTASTWANCPWFRPWILSKTAKPEQLHVASRLDLKAKLNPWFTRKV